MINEQVIITGGFSDKNKIKIWNFPKLELQNNLIDSHEAGIQSMVIAKDAIHLITGCEEGKLFLTDIP